VRDDRPPSENVQNLPRSGKVREAHIARPGKVLVGIDYGHLELDCLAQVTYEMFGYSRMLETINAGRDPHSMMGAQLMSLKQHKEISYKEFFKMLKDGNKDCKFFRQMAKAANFGYPGGLGAKRMVEYAKNTYGIDDMTLEASIELRDVFLKTYPEVEELFTWYKYQEDVNGWAYSSSGRWRARCGYCDGLNGIALQSRSADGAKTAGLLLAEACELGQLSDCDLLAFIHDEYIIEMPNDDRLAERVDIAMTLMLEGMQQILPDVRITVEADAMERWVKDGPFVYSTAKSLDPKGVTA
jgi:DNA polymerase-1